MMPVREYCLTHLCHAPSHLRNPADRHRVRPKTRVTCPECPALQFARENVKQGVVRTHRRRRKYCEACTGCPHRSARYRGATCPASALAMRLPRRWRRSRRQATLRTPSRRAGGLRPHRGGAGGRARQRDAGTVGGLRERPECLVGGEPERPRHRSDPRQRDDEPRRGGIRWAGGVCGARPRHYRYGGGKRPKSSCAACRRVGRCGSDGALSRPGAQQRQG